MRSKPRAIAMPGTGTLARDRCHRNHVPAAEVARFGLTDSEPPCVMLRQRAEQCGSPTKLQLFRGRYDQFLARGLKRAGEIRAI